MRKRLCTYCIRKHCATDPEYPRKALEAITDGQLEVVAWSHNCDHFREPGHPRGSRLVLEDLPPSALDKPPRP